MWMLAALCCVAAVGSAAGTTVCSNLTIDGDTYREETLVNDMDFPNNLAVDYSTNLLYFSYKRNGVWFSAVLNLSTRAVDKVEELTGACTFSVDQALHQVYAGCYGHGTGLYRLNSSVGRFEPYGELGQPVRFVYYNDVLYYSIHGSYLLHTFRDGHGVREESIQAPVEGLVIDKHQNRIFYNSAGLYQQHAGAVEATRYTGLSGPYALAINASGATYTCGYWSDGIYRLHEHEQTPNATKLLDVRLCTGLAFDRDDNIIYAKLYQLQDNTLNGRIVRLVKC